MKKKSSKKRKAASKKKTLKRKLVRKKKGVAKKRVSKKKTPAQRRSPKLPTEPIGKVTHYFPQVKAAAILIERDGVRVGDTLYFKGHTTQFKQQVSSLQIDREPVTQASSGEEVGIQVKSRVREHDLVFKL